MNRASEVLTQQFGIQRAEMTSDKSELLRFPQGAGYIEKEAAYLGNSRLAD